MGKFDKILICSDLDSTLTFEEKIPENNMEAIRYFCAEGGKFCVSTGRLPKFLLEKHFTKEILSNCPAICCNGTCIYDFNTEKIVYEKKITSDCGCLTAALDNIKKLILRATIFVSGPSSVDLLDFENEIGKISNVIKTDGLYKIVLVFKDEITAENTMHYLEEKLIEYFNISRSWPVGLEIIEKSATKGDAINVLKNNILADSRTTIAVGDYENDITMLKAADIGCAVENAVSALKASADKIICHSKDGAIDYIVKNILCDI